MSMEGTEDSGLLSGDVQLGTFEMVDKPAITTAQIETESELPLHNNNSQISPEPGRIVTGIPRTTPDQAFNEDRYYVGIQREAKWADIRKYSEYIRRFASADVAHLEITKENYYDLYNMGVSLLKSIDGLDPDKSHSLSSLPPPQKRELSMSPSTTAVIHSATAMPNLMSPEMYGNRKPMEYMYRGFYPPNYADIPPMLYENQTPLKRRRQSQASKRNLVCAICGVTKTPEWRRGPAGDHTLCNACGLQYAKSVKKGKKDKPQKTSGDIQQALSDANTLN